MRVVYIHMLATLTDSPSIDSMPYLYCMIRPSTRLYTLSVQFLNRSAFVKGLVEKHHLLQILSGCLVSTLAPACRRQSVAGGAPGNQGRPPVVIIVILLF